MKHVTFTIRADASKVLFNSKPEILEKFVGKNINDDVFIRLLLKRNVKITYRTINSLNKVIGLVDTDTKLG